MNEAKFQIGNTTYSIASKTFPELIDALLVLKHLPEMSNRPLPIELELAQLNRAKGIIAFKRRTSLELNEARRIMYKELGLPEPKKINTVVK